MVGLRISSGDVDAGQAGKQVRDVGGGGIGGWTWNLCDRTVERLFLWLR